MPLLVQHGRAWPAPEAALSAFWAHRNRSVPFCPRPRPNVGVAAVAHTDGLGASAHRLGRPGGAHHGTPASWKSTPNYCFLLDTTRRTQNGRWLVPGRVHTDAFAQAPPARQCREVGAIPLCRPAQNDTLHVCACAGAGAQCLRRAPSSRRESAATTERVGPALDEQSWREG